MATAEAGIAFLTVLAKETGYFDSVLRNVRDIRVPEPGRLQCTLLVDESMQNRCGSAHRPAACIKDQEIYQVVLRLSSSRAHCREKSPGAALPLRARNATLHGGCTATIVDTVGSAALVTVSKRGGVSIAINTTYLAGMPMGEDVEVEAKVARVRTGPSAWHLPFEAGPQASKALNSSFVRTRRWGGPSQPSTSSSGGS